MLMYGKKVGKAVLIGMAYKEVLGILLGADENATNRSSTNENEYSESISLQVSFRDVKALAVTVGVHFENVSTYLVKKTRTGQKNNLLTVNWMILRKIHEFMQPAERSNRIKKHIGTKQNKVYAGKDNIVFDCQRNTMEVIRMPSMAVVIEDANARFANARDAAANNIEHKPAVQKQTPTEKYIMRKMKNTDPSTFSFSGSIPSSSSGSSTRASQEDAMYCEISMEDGVNELFIACQRGESGIVKLILERGDVDVNQEAVANTVTLQRRQGHLFEGWTPLIVACDRGHSEIVEQLLATPEIDINKADAGGITGLMNAAMRGHLKIVEQLLGHPNIEKDKRDDTGRTALMNAQGFPDIQQMIRDHRGPTPPLDPEEQKELDDFLALHKFDRTDLNSKNEHGMTTLHLAVKQGKENMIATLIANGADPNAKINYDGFDGKTEITPLHFAVKEGRENMIATLIANGADPNAKNDQQKTPLHMAKTFDVIDLLIANWADPDLEDDEGNKALDVAIRRMQRYSPLRVRYDDLRRRDARLQKQINKGKGSSNRAPLDVVAPSVLFLDVTRRRSTANKETPLEDDDGYEGRVSLESFLESNKFDSVNLNARNEKRMLPLNLAVHFGMYSVITSLISRGAYPNARDGGGQTSLHIAASQGEDSVIQTLITNGANPNAMAIDSQRQRPLHLASKHDVITALLAHGAHADLPDAKGNKALDFAKQNCLRAAVEQGDECLVSSLIAEGVNPNAQNWQGQTPLHLAAYNGRKNVVVHLIANGGNPETADRTGQTPLHCAATTGHESLIELLVTHGADPNATDSRGRTPLHKAAEYARDSAVAALIANGADRDLEDHEGMTALDLANKKICPGPHCTKTIEILQNHTSKNDDVDTEIRRKSDINSTIYGVKSDRVRLNTASFPENRQLGFLYDAQNLELLRLLPLKWAICHTTLRLYLGWRIIEINGIKMSNKDEFEAFKRECKPGELLVFILTRPKTED